MNRTEMIDFISKKAGITKAAATDALNAFFEGVTDSLQKGNPAVFPNFGAFIVKERAAREGRNPSTGEKIKIKAAKVVGFKAGKGLKEAVKEDV